MRLILAAAVLALPSAAFAFDKPEDVITELYKPFAKTDWDYVDPAPLQSVGLNLLFEQDQKDADGEIGRIDFDPYVDGQDALITDLVIVDSQVLGGTARVTVTFKNFDTPEKSIYSLVLERDGWKIDDVANLEADGTLSYSLRDILTQPFP